MRVFLQLVFLVIILVSITLITRKEDEPIIEIGPLTSRTSASFSNVQEKLKNMTPEQEKLFEQKIQEDRIQQNIATHEAGIKAIKYEIGLVETMLILKKNTMSPEEVRSAESYIEEQKELLKSQEETDKFQSTAQAVSR